VSSFHEEFDLEFQALNEDLQDEFLAHAKLLQEFGPQLGRPVVDTLKGSKHANMKELRFEWKREVWRVAFAFGSKTASHSARGRRQGRSRQKRFYDRLIATADRRFDGYLAALKAAEGGKKRKERSRGKKS
jgi:hypothetical protein